ncbi:MAG TPA: hypothetical protein PLT03_04455, partial [Bacillota bacterium]|nr:hypothetical protein [Bacillota bacterium]
PDAIGRMLEQVMSRRFSYPPGMDPKVPLHLKESLLEKQEPEDNEEATDYPAGAPLPNGNHQSPQEQDEGFNQASFDFNGGGGDAEADVGAGEGTGSQPSESKPSTRLDLCPSCGNNSLVYESGCESCVVCGYSRC